MARDHLQFMRGADALVGTALRTRSVHAREMLVELAWPGHELDDLLAAAALTGRPLPQDASGLWVGRLGYLLALQDIEPDDRRNASVLLEALVRTVGLDGLTMRPAEVLATLRFLDGDLDGALGVVDAARMRPDVAAALRVDALNPALTARGDTDAWLARLNTFLHEDRATAVRLADDGPSMFDRLTTAPVAPVASPYRVTVAMSTYRPGEELLTAVGSLLRQSWTNLEILVVDDASGSAYDDVLGRVERLDARVRVIRKAINGGTYRARNTALRQATGDVFTVLDSDDWMHPEAIERSMRPLLESADVIATRHLGIRVPGSLQLARVGYRPRYVTAPSLMFRMAPVLARIGFFDPTRKGADTEYAKRLEAAFHRPVVDIDEVLTIQRSGESLSSSEFSPRWRHGSRFAYKCLYEPWHARIASDAADPFLDDGAPRRFPEPRRWTRPLAGAEPERLFDVCFAGDWRRYGGPQRSMLAEIDAAARAGLRIAVMHLEAFRFMTRDDLPLCEPLLDLLRAGTVELVQIDDDVEIDLLLVRYPPVLQYPSRVRSPVRVRSTVVVANQAPLEPDGSDQRYVVRDVTARAEETFRAPVTWSPQSPRIRRILQAEDPGVALTDWDDTGLIDVQEWERPTTGWVRGADEIVVGRYSRDHEIKFPATYADLEAAYTFGPGYTVRVMGGTSQIRKLARAAGRDDEELPPSWELTAHKSMDVHDFLAGIDFFVYYDNPHRHEAFGRVLLEAAASGVVTIADPRHRETFGEVIDYAPPGQAQELVAAYVADPDRYAARSAQSRRLVAERFGYGSFVEKILPLLTHPSRDRAPEASPVAGPLEMSIHDRGPLSPLQVRVDGGHHLVAIPVRTLADGALMDELVLVTTAPTDAVSRWARTLLSGVERLAFEPRSLASAPDAVVAAVFRHAGSVGVATRGEPARTEGLAAGASAIGGWDIHRMRGGVARVSAPVTPGGSTAPTSVDAGSPLPQGSRHER